MPQIDSDLHSESNRRIYHDPAVLASYRVMTLSRMESIALLKHYRAFAGRSVLDLGIGTGRTSIYLAPLAARYEGIDFSPVMIEAVRASMPELSTRCADIRDLSMFADRSFDFVFGSNNVIDAVPHEDRMRALAEFRRVLAPGGCLMFSSHNREFRDALQGPRLELSRNPVTMVGNVVRWMRRLSTHASIRGLRREEEGYALLNDGGHEYAVLHYYIAPGAQRRQLASAGFRVIDVLDVLGRSLEPGATDPDSHHLMYVAVRAEIS